MLKHEKSEFSEVWDNPSRKRFVVLDNRVWLGRTGRMGYSVQTKEYEPAPPPRKRYVGKTLKTTHHYKMGPARASAKRMIKEML
jgi:hypothetical protein